MPATVPDAPTQASCSIAARRMFDGPKPRGPAPGKGRLAVNKVFLDTNLIVYANDGRDAQKQAQAIELVSAAIQDGTGVISTQVMQEYAVVAGGKLRQDLDTILRQLLLLESLEVVQITPALIRRALELQFRYQIDYWDAGILAAAEYARLPCALVGGPQPGPTLRDSARRKPIQCPAQENVVVFVGAHSGRGNSSFSGIFSESGASPRIICVAAPVSFKYQSGGSPS